MLGFEITDGRRGAGITQLQPFKDHVLLRVMAGIRIVGEIVDDRVYDLVIRALATIEQTQLPF